MNLQTSVKADNAELQRLGPRRGLFHAAEGFSSRRAATVPGRYAVALVERLRKEEPVHYCTNAPIEPYWSVTKYNDNHACRHQSHGIFSSDVSLGGISIRDVPPGYDWPSFIAMDQPRHSAQRKTVSPMFTTDASGRTRRSDPRTLRQGARRAAA